MFYLFASVAVLGAVNVIVQKKAMHAAFALLVSLSAVAGVYMVLGARVIGLFQLIVYAGAVMVLFVIAIMLLEPGSISGLRFQSWVWGLLSFLLGVGMFGLILVAVVQHAEKSPPARVPPGDPGSVQALSEALFTRFLLPFEAVSILVLIALVGAVALCKRPRVRC